MKKIPVSIYVYLWLLFFCFSISAQDFKAIHDGIEYTAMKSGTETEPFKINLLRLDLTKVRLDVVLNRTMTFEENLDKQIAALTAEQVNAAMHKYLTPDKISVFKAGDFAKAKEKIKAQP